MMGEKSMEQEMKIKGRCVNLIQETKITIVRVSFQSCDHSDDRQCKSLLYNYLCFSLKQFLLVTLDSILTVLTLKKSK